ncbi:hypothetical protein KVT40_005104 [Elsinoe batatas]|uniref:Uncharacterized protein n=1 Tax=Elsinoe batatas TaxID=2601811 RepID=A0A8K0L4L9_9PEZI|nr:hypothetical protein KVT40_005104 [Elsinoe batatas]
MVFDEREFGRLLKWEGGRGVKVPPRKKVTVQYLKRKGNHLLGNNYEVLTEVKVEREGGLRWGDVVDEIKGDEGVRKCAMQQRRAFLKAVSDEKRWAEREATRKRTSGSIVSFLRNPFKHPFWRGYETEDILVGVQPEVGSGDETADAPPDPTAYGVFAATDVDLQPIYDRPCEWEGEVCIDCEYQMRTVVATL